jgi:hypothetical protein
MHLCVLQGSAAAKSLSSFAAASPGQRGAGGGVGGFNANMRMMGGGASLAHSMKAEAQGVTESVSNVSAISY